MIAVMKKIQGARAIAAALTIALVGLTVVGCGGKEEPAPAAPATESAPVSEAIDSAVDTVQDATSEAVEMVKGVVSDAPSTIKALSLLPDEAQFAVGIPPLTALEDAIVPIANRVWGEEAVQEEIENFTRDIAMQTGQTDAESIEEIASAKGIDPDAAIAIFGDLTPMADSAIAFAEEHADDAPEAREEAMEDFEPDVPSWAVALGITDKAVAEASIQNDLIEGIPDLQTANHTTENVGDISVEVYDDYAYFLTDDQAVLGTLALVKSAAARVGNPQSFRYGTSACPAYADDEIVSLIYPNRTYPLITRVLESLEGDAELDAMVQMQLAMVQEVFKGESDDPIVTTLTANDDDVSLVSRIDTEQHAGVLAYAGEAQPLRLARLLPDHTLAMLSYRINDELKQYFNDIVFPAAEEAMGDDGTKQGVAIAKQGIGMLGDELTIGITGVQDDFPEAYIMLALADPESTKGLLQMFIPAMPGETYTPEGGQDVEISSIAAPIPIPLSIAYPGDMVLVSNNTDGMKKIIDHMAAESTSELFAALEPPLDPEVPRYNGIVFNSKLIEDLMPVVMLAGGDVRDAQPVIEQITPVVREVRAFSEMHGVWSVTNVSVYLKDES